MTSWQRIWLAASFLLVAWALVSLSEPKSRKVPTMSKSAPETRVQFVVDSVRVQELARELAAKQGDSLRSYWRGYWRNRVPKTDTIEIVQTDTVETTDTVAEIWSDDELFRQSILQNETCNIALDSNRSAVATLSYDLEEAVSTLNSCEDSRKWYAIGGGALGYLLGAITP